MSSSQRSLTTTNNNGSGSVDYYAKGYKEGMITRVYMKNFLTFDECEGFPGPYLNVVIGPNGSGKSSMTHAICLACNGGTKDVGRAQKLNTFVKRGKEDQECYVEVDIVESQYRVLTIRRVIFAEKNSSKFYLNRVQTTQKEIDRIVLKYQIDVDNLCTFMPQDRVGEFSRYKPKELLEHTLRTVNNSVWQAQALAALEKELEDEKGEKGEKKRKKNGSKGKASALDSDDDEDDEENDWEEPEEEEEEELRMSRKKKGSSSSSNALTTIASSADQYKNLREEQEALANIEKTKLTLRQEKDNKAYERDSVTRELQSLQSELNKLHERDRLKKEKALFEVKVLELGNIQVTKERELQVTRQGVLSQQLQQERNVLQPLEQEVRELKAAYDGQYKQENRIQQSLHQSSTRIKILNESIKQLDEEMETISVDLETLETNHLAKQQRLQRVNQEAQVERRKLEELEELLPAIEHDIVNIETESRQVMDAVEQTTSSIQQLQESIREVQQGQMLTLRRQLESLRNPREMYKEKLRKFTQTQASGGNQILSHCVQAMEWIDNNLERLQQEGKLKQDVYHPACSYLTAHSPIIASMVNKFIPVAKLFGIIALCDADAQFLKHQLRSVLKLNVNVYTMKNTDPNHGSFTRQRYFSRDYLAEQRLGYLSEAIDCPDIIRAYLYSFCMFHCVLYGINHDRELNIEELQTLANHSAENKMIQVYLHVSSKPQRSQAQPYPGEILEYVARKSRYAAANAPPSTKVQVVEYFPFNVIKALNNNSSNGSSSGAMEDEDSQFQRQQQELRTQLDAFQQRVNQTTQQMKSLQETNQQRQLEYRALQQQKADLKKKLRGPDAIRAKLQTLEQEINRLKQQLSTASIEQEMTTKKRVYERCVTQMLQQMDELVKVSGTFSSERSLVTLNKRLTTALQDRYEEKEIALKQAKKNVATLEKQLQEVEKQIKDLDEMISEIESEMMSLIANELGGEESFLNGHGYEEMVTLTAPIEQAFFQKYNTNASASSASSAGGANPIVTSPDELPIEAIASLAGEFEEKSIQIKAELGHIHDNPIVIARHQQLTQELPLLEKEVAQLTKAYQEFEQSYTHRITSWLTKVRSIVNKINTAFSKYMKELDCRGEVHLQDATGADAAATTGIHSEGNGNIGESLLEYALQIYVSFRENAALTPLTGFIQSGGERAVSTIMFLSALQSINSSPFRVVDEINQGMDEFNERRVIDRIARACLPPLTEVIEGGDADTSDGRERSLQQTEWLQSRHNVLEHYPQYFLVTPKLLPAIISLKDPRVTVMVLWNSEGVKAKFSIADMIHIVRMNEQYRRRSMLMSGSSGGDSNVVEEEDDEEEEREREREQRERERQRKVSKPSSSSSSSAVVVASSQSLAPFQSQSQSQPSAVAQKRKRQEEDVFPSTQPSLSQSQSQSQRRVVEQEEDSGEVAVKKRTKVAPPTAPVPAFAIVKQEPGKTTASSASSSSSLSGIVVKPEPGAFLAARHQQLKANNQNSNSLSFIDLTQSDNEEKENEREKKATMLKGKTSSSSGSTTKSTPMKAFPIFGSLNTFASPNTVNHRRGSGIGGGSAVIDLT